MEAALDLFVERPWDQITLAAIAERAGVGLQTVIRRFGTKDGGSRAVNEWIAPQISETRGEPGGSDPAAVAAVLARHYERWGREHGPHAAPGGRLARALRAPRPPGGVGSDHRIHPVPESP